MSKEENGFPRQPPRIEPLLPQGDLLSCACTCSNEFPGRHFHPLSLLLGRCSTRARSMEVLLFESVLQCTPARESSGLALCVCVRQSERLSADGSRATTNSPLFSSLPHKKTKGKEGSDRFHFKSPYLSTKKALRNETDKKGKNCEGEEERNRRFRFSRVKTDSHRTETVTVTVTVTPLDPHSVLRSVEVAPPPPAGKPRRGFWLAGICLAGLLVGDARTRASVAIRPLSQQRQSLGTVPQATIERLAPAQRLLRVAIVAFDGRRTCHPSGNKLQECDMFPQTVFSSYIART